MSDDFNHYFDATQRLTAENALLRAQVETLTKRNGELDRQSNEQYDAQQRQIESQQKQIETLKQELSADTARIEVLVAEKHDAVAAKEKAERILSIVRKDMTNQANNYLDRIRELENYLNRALEAAGRPGESFDNLYDAISSAQSRLASMTSGDACDRATAAFISHNILTKAGIHECVKVALKAAAEGKVS